MPRNPPRTTLHPTAVVVTVSTLCMVDPGVDDLIQLRMEIPDAAEADCHVISLSVAEAEAVRGLLAGGGQLSDDDGPWLTVARGGSALTLLPERWHYVGLRELEAALSAALATLKAHPPRLCAVDPRIGVVQAIDSAGTLQSVSVTVEAEVMEADAPRVMIDWVGTWWLTVSEVTALADALSGADLSLTAGADPIPWLVVRQEPGRVLLQLYDALVAEDGDDGVLWLSGAAAADLSAILRAALAWAAGNPPNLYVPPEPGPREVMRVPL